MSDDVVGIRYPRNGLLYFVINQFDSLSLNHINVRVTIDFNAQNLAPSCLIIMINRWMQYQQMESGRYDPLLHIPPSWYNGPKILFKNLSIGNIDIKIDSPLWIKHAQKWKNFSIYEGYYL